MKTFVQWTLALAALAMLALAEGNASAQPFYGGMGFGSGMEQNSVLTIKADGSCLFVTETVEPRKVAEQQVRMMERFEKMSESSEEGAGGIPQMNSSSTNATKPFTDEELTKKITDMMNERADQGGEGSGQKLDVKVEKDTVRLTTTRSFASIKEMLGEGASIWSASGVMFENVRFETDTNGLLRVTLTPQKGMERYMKAMRSTWKLSGARMELKLIFPGKVISSGLPEMQTNATWLAMDAKQEKSLDAMDKLYTGPTVITAGSGGLKLAAPLESKNLERSFRQREEAGADLPVTDAGPGFSAEAEGITTTTLHVFPGGEAYFKQEGNNYESQTGTVVSAKLFAPRGRTLLSVNDVKVLAAVDDHGRSVATETSDDDETQSEFTSGGSSPNDSLPIQLQLQLPQPDARAIDKISAEAVAVTAGKWREMTLTNLQENATNEFDLAGLLPGAKIVVTKFSLRNMQFSLQARLEGPGAVRRLQVKAKIPGNDNFNSYSTQRSFNVHGKETTIPLNIQGYGFNSSGAISPKSVVLVVRFPEDLRRERVKFSLTGLDLF
jgi:hypothetical protein